MPLRARSSQMVANSMASAMLPFSVERTTRSRERRIGVGELELDGHALGELEVLHVLGVEHLHHDDILIRHRAVVDQIVHAAQR